MRSKAGKRKCMPDLPDRDFVFDEARRLLSRDPDPGPRYRLLRDILAPSSDEVTIKQAADDLERSRWIAQLHLAQCQDGSWGRFHSQDSATRLAIPTTEAAVARACNLGLDRHHPILRLSVKYLRALLDGALPFPDPPEKNDRWTAGSQLFVAATLAGIAPFHPALDPIWQMWLQIAGQTFRDGKYNPRREAEAHRRITGASFENSYLALHSKYHFALLGARAAHLPEHLEEAYVSWIWTRRPGMGYLEARLCEGPKLRNVGHIERWFASHELLSAFPSWKQRAGTTMEQLMRLRGPNGWWDFGPRASHSRFLPLSEDWRRGEARLIDWSTRVLLLMHRYASPVAEPSERSSPPAETERG
jgi:hypothetical protein